MLSNQLKAILSSEILLRAHDVASRLLRIISGKIIKCMIVHIQWVRTIWISTVKPSFE